MLSSEEKAKMAHKIRALLAKTVDKGCSEAEAMAAAIKAKELIDAHQINLSEYELEQEGFTRGKAEKPWQRRFNVQWALCAVIASFCEVKVWGSYEANGTRRSEKRVVFFGLQSDVEFANWLLVALESFIWSNADQFEQELRMKQGPNAGGYYVKRDFAMGACARIGERLREAIKARTPQVMGDGRSLMIVKQALVQREFNKLGFKLGSGTAQSFNRGDAPADAYAAGRAAGDRASFGRPVGASSGPRLKLT
jgi:hypothetical protein